MLFTFVMDIRLLCTFRKSFIVHEIKVALIKFLLKFTSILLLQGHQYETVSGFICESFGYIPEEGGKTVVVLKKENQEENSEYTDTESKHHNKETNQTYELEVCFHDHFY